METVPEAPKDNGAGNRSMWIRLGSLVAFTVALVVVAKATGFSSHFKPDEIRSRVAAAGLWGPALYLAVFSVGELVHIPGTVFVAAAVIAYGRPVGGSLAFVGAILSLSVAFVVVRAVGGKPLGQIRWSFVRRMLAHLDEHPVRTVVLLRLVLWMTPQLNYALALSNVTFKSYFVGSVVGLAAPITILVCALDYFLR